MGGSAAPPRPVSFPEGSCNELPPSGVGIEVAIARWPSPLRKDRTKPEASSTRSGSVKSSFLKLVLPEAAAAAVRATEGGESAAPTDRSRSSRCIERGVSSESGVCSEGGQRGRLED